jgi:hypothetical protein
MILLQAKKQCVCESSGSNNNSNNSNNKYMSEKDGKVNYLYLITTLTLMLNITVPCLDDNNNENTED